MSKKEKDAFNVDIVNELPVGAALDLSREPAGKSQSNITATSSINSTSDENIAKLFKERNIVFLSTLSRDGSPSVTPVWADIEDNMILVNSFEDSAKVKNAKRDPRVALAVVETYNTYNMVSIKGRVTEITAEGADAHIHKLATKYLGIGKYHYRKPKSNRVILKIKPEKVFGLENHPASLFLAYTVPA
jgi:PPOX class probable F420-dependent enzyme